MSSIYVVPIHSYGFTGGGKWSLQQANKGGESLDLAHGLGLLSMVMQMKVYFHVQVNIGAAL